MANQTKTNERVFKSLKLWSSMSPSEKSSFVLDLQHARSAAIKEHRKAKRSPTKEKKQAKTKFTFRDPELENLIQLMAKRTGISKEKLL